MLTDSELAAYIELGHETRAIEYKAAGSLRDAAFCATVARAAMAMANQRDGGHVVIGVDDDRPHENAGMPAHLLMEWLDFDSVAAKLNAFADPPMQLHVAERHHPAGSSVVIVEVAEFDEVPILCKKDFSGKLSLGQLYTRSMAQPASSSMYSQNELRAVLDLATEKQLASFLRRAARANIGLTGMSEPGEEFRAHAAEFAMSERASALSAGACMFLECRPETFVRERIPYASITEVIAKSAVRMRGVPFPYVSEPITGDDWIAEHYDRGREPESWSLYQSGLFLEYKQLPLDTGPDMDSLVEPSPGDRYLPVWWPIAYFTEAFAFASRLQRSAFPDEAATIRIGARGIEGWILAVADARRSGFHGRYAYGGKSWERTIEMTPTMALTDARDEASRLSKEFLSRFGWRGVSEEIVRSLQDDLFGSPR